MIFLPAILGYKFLCLYLQVVMNKSLFLTASLSVILLSLSGCVSAVSQEKAEVVAPQNQVSDSVPAKTDIETRVTTLENQMKIAQPTLKKVEAMETHFKALSFELDKITETYSIADTTSPTMKSIPMSAHPVTIQPEAAPFKAQAVEPVEKKDPEVKKASTPAEFSVTSVRIGEQGKDITRIVLDTTNPAEINYDLDNVEGLLVIEIPKAKWSTTKSQVFQKSPMIKSFQALEDEKGSRFVADLKQKSKVVATARLNPSGKSGHRVYIDITPVK
jgi:hypothetical protein